MSLPSQDFSLLWLKISHSQLTSLWESNFAFLSPRSILQAVLSYTKGLLLSILFYFAAFSAFTIASEEFLQNFSLSCQYLQNDAFWNWQLADTFHLDASFRASVVRFELENIGWPMRIASRNFFFFSMLNCNDSFTVIDSLYTDYFWFFPSASIPIDLN